MSSIAYDRILDALNISSSTEYIDAFYEMASDTHQLIRSSSRFWALVLAPFIKIISIALRAVAPYVQSATKHAWEWQISRSNEFVAFEVVAALGMLVLYMLKRHIAKQQYVPRLLSYIEAKKTRAKRRYDTSIAKVRDFNATLASILPHFLYFSLCFLLWRIARPIISWLADDTYATPFLSTFYPVFGTMAVLQRRALLVSGGIPPSTPASALSASTSSPTPAPAPSSSKHSGGLGFSSPLTSPTSMLRVGGGKRRTSSVNSNTTSPEVALAQAEELESDANAAVQYWVVFGVVSATYTFLSYIPFVGSYTSSLHALASPLKLFFFLWLHLPMDATELLYRYLCPLALQFADRTTGKAKRRKRKKKRNDSDSEDDEEEEKDTVASIISKLTSLLKLATMVGLCGPKTRDRANVVLRESLSVLPSLICLFMPSYFTSYGVIWSSLLVPAANSARANKGGETKGRDRWLKYWCVYAVLAGVLEFLSGILSWVPFSTHAVLLLYIGASLPGLGLCEMVFQLVVNESVGLGLITSDGFGEVGEVIMVRVIRFVSLRSKKRVEEGDMEKEFRGVVIEKRGEGGMEGEIEEESVPTMKSALLKKED